MTCPACGGELKPGGSRCPVCDAAVAVAPRTEGALAADSRLVTPPSRGRAKADAAPVESREAREARERSWRDEVQERVRSRRQKRVAAGLPLFDSVGEAPPAAPALRPTEPAPGSTTDIGEIELKRADDEGGDPLASSRSRGGSWHELTPGEVVPAPLARSRERSSHEPAVSRREPAVERSTREPDPLPLQPDAPSDSSTSPPAMSPEPPEPAPVAVEERAGADVFSPVLSEAELADLPLRTVVPPDERGPAVDHVVERELEPAPTAGASRRRLSAAPQLQPVVPSLDDEILLDGRERESELELPPPASEPSAVERPARAVERAQAAAFDLAVFVVLAVVVVYFAGRAARVELASLTSAWGWVVSFLGVLGVFYAGYFTGTTGQTPGKLVTGLRVVGTSGRPPAYPRAAARAVAGLVGIALAGTGLLPIVFDPARRALHDRLFRTRVVRG